MSLLKEKKGIGVIVCRMQVPYLTDSHKSMIQTVLDRHDRIVILLGNTNKPVDSKDPYPFEFRKQMLSNTQFSRTRQTSEHSRSTGLVMLGTFDNVTIIPLADQNDNKLWVNYLDMMVSAFLSYDEDAVLYGGRDSFIPYYTKENHKFKCVELAAADYDSGTKLRELISVSQPNYSMDAAAAKLWTLRQCQK